MEGPHPPEARLHKWEARKDAGVVAAVVEAGSRPGELVVDPFMGAGTAPLAAARLGRRALGIDLSPLAVRLARAVAAPADPAGVEATRRRIEERLRGPAPRRVRLGDTALSLRELYAARCPSCGEAAELAHAVWSVRVACACGAVTAAHALAAGARRGGSGARLCPACGGAPARGGAAYRGEELHLLFVRCPAHGLVESAPGPGDVALAERCERGRGEADVWTPAGVALRYPGGAPLAQLRHSLRARPVLDELWTGRNFVATGLLAEAIAQEAAGAEREALELSLSAVVKATSRMPTRNTGGWRNKGTGLSSHLLGVFPMHLEQNAWEELDRHVRTRLVPGLAAARALPQVRLVEDPVAPGDVALRLGDARARLRELPAGCAGLAFADPPYGDAVQYAELSVPNVAWLARPLAGEALQRHVQDTLGAAALSEVVENPAQRKDRRRFLADLAEVLGELRRVLRPGRDAVVTFNSPEEALVRGVVEAAAGAGLSHVETREQAAFKPSHKGAWHARTAKGTLYLTFRRA